MRKAAREKTAAIPKYAGGLKTKKKYIIRMNRKDEINAGWCFLILCQFIFFLLIVTKRHILLVLLAVVGGIIILFVALIYQGLEVLQE